MSRKPKRPASGQHGRRPAPARRRPRTSIIDRLISLLPVSEAALARAATWTITGAVLAGLATMMVWMGVPGMVGVAAAEQLGKAGLRVQQIEVTGLSRMDRLSVYAVALEQKSRAMPLVDLEGVRARLRRYGWIEDAQVSRRLPDTLLIHIIERKPSVVWQDKGRLWLLAKGGVLLQEITPEDMPADLPRIIGPGADQQESSYQALMQVAPALRPQIIAATWVGNRRWTLTFESGEELLLPADQAEAHQALAKFAERDAVRPLLGKGWVRFDMRDPKFIVARKPGTFVNHAVAPADADAEGAGADAGEAEDQEAAKAAEPKRTGEARRMAGALTV